MLLEHFRNASLNCERKVIKLAFENVLREPVLHNMWAISGSLDLFWWVISEFSLMKNVWKETERNRGAEFFKSFLIEGTEYLTGVSLTTETIYPEIIARNKFTNFCQDGSETIKSIALYEVNMHISVSGTVWEIINISPEWQQMRSHCFWDI